MSRGSSSLTVFDLRFCYGYVSIFWGFTVFFSSYIFFFVVAYNLAFRSSMVDALSLIDWLNLFFSSLMSLLSYLSVLTSYLTWAISIFKLYMMMFNSPILPSLSRRRTPCSCTYS